MKIYRRLTFLSILMVGMMFVIGSGEEETVDSDIINTHGIVADIDILATSNSTQIYADLTAKDTTDIIDLTNEQATFSVQAIDGTGEVRETEYLNYNINGYTNNATKNIYHYLANMDEYAGGITIDIALLREDEVNAESSTIILPAYLDLSIEGGVTQYSSDQEITFEWNESDQYDVEVIGIRVDYECCYEDTQTSNTKYVTDYWIDTINLDLQADPGQKSYTLNQLVEKAGIDESVEDYDCGCEIDITINRKNSGDVDNAFAFGSTIHAMQSDSIQVIYNP